MASVIIRPIHTKDWKHLREIRLRALRENPKALGLADTDEAMRTDEQWQAICRDAQNGRGKWFVIAEDNGAFVGMLGAIETFGTYMRHLVEIVQAYVVPEHRQQGVMTHLFKVLKTELQKAQHLEQMIVWVTLHEEQVGKTMFEQWGFTYAGTLSKAIKVEGRYYDCCWLEAPL